MRGSQRSIALAGLVYLAQIPVVIGCILGVIPIHPIVIMLPLVGLLNGKVEGKGPGGLGLILFQPGRSLLLAVAFAALELGQRYVLLRFEGASVAPIPLTSETLLNLAGQFAVGVFIIALFEEVVNRGYIQTRLQEAFGFWGVVATALMFASLHLPSAFLEFDYDLTTSLLYFLRIALNGLMLGYAYWQTGSVFTALAIHGLRNFIFGLTLNLSPYTAAQMHASHLTLQSLWALGELVLMWAACRTLFGSEKGR